MTLKSGLKFEEKLPCGLENDLRNLEHFHQSTRKCQNWNFDGILLSNKEMHELKTYRSVTCHDNEE